MLQFFLYTCFHRANEEMHAEIPEQHINAMQMWSRCRKIKFYYGNIAMHAAEGVGLVTGWLAKLEEKLQT